MFFKKKILRATAILLLPLLILSAISVSALSKDAVPISDDDISTVTDLALDCKSAVLMEASTGKILYEQNADEALPPASVTKVMTLLLVMEALDQGKIKLDDIVTTSERAASMGGSQIFL